MLILNVGLAKTSQTDRSSSGGKESGKSRLRGTHQQTPGSVVTVTSVLTPQGPWLMESLIGDFKG